MRGRIPELDGLRGLAIFLVLVWHYVTVNVRAPHHSWISRALVFTGLTWSGVDLFFVLSGFLIGGILLDVRRAHNYYKAFYARRFLRIVPAYALLCAVFGLACKAGGQRWWGTAGAWEFGNPPPWYVCALFLQDFWVAARGHFNPLPIMVTWSLAVEEQFYFTLPLVIRFVPPKRLLPLVAGIVVVIPMARIATHVLFEHGGLASYALMPLRADSLLMGVVAALLVRDPASWNALLRSRNRLKALAATVAVILCLFVGLHWTTHEAPPMATVGYSVIALFYTSILLLAVTSERGRLAALLRARWLRSLGEVAYGVYLFHIGIEGIWFGLLFGHEPRLARPVELVATVLALASTVVLARLSWKFFEKRLVVTGHRFRYERAPEADTAADTSTSWSATRPTPS